MQRIAAALLLLAGSVSAGFYAALREKRRLKLLLSFAGAVQAMRWELLSSRTEAGMLLAKHLNALGGSREEIRKRVELLPLRTAERESLDDFLTRFGSGDQSCECERCSAVEQQLRTIVERDREESEKKAKLYLSGGVLGGLFLTLLII